MTNDTTRTMPTAEEIEAMAERLRSPDVDFDTCDEATEMLSYIANQMHKSELSIVPAAWIRTCHYVGTCNSPPEIDIECVPGCDKPAGSGWALLYESPLADTEDARRYRWLRENTRDSFDGSPHILSWHTGCNYVYSGEAADKAIDAYMKESGNDHPTD